MTDVIRKTPDACGIYHYAINVINPGDYPTDEWLHDPVVSHLTEASPTVPPIYWKVVGSPLSVVEMSQGEKDAVDECRGGSTVSDDQTFDDDEPAGPTNIWSSEKITQLFSKRDRVCILHNGSTTQAFQNTFINIQFDTVERLDSAYYTYNAGDGSVTVVNTGWYLIMAGIGVEATSTSRNTSVAELRIAGGAVDGGKGYGYHYGDQSSQTIAARGFVYLTALQKVQVFAARDWGKSTLQTLPNSCRLALVTADPIPSGSPPV